jgi:hypothetical protein
MRRLGKQRLEALQLINFIENNHTAWKNHPARLMWEGYTDALKIYLDIVIKEWIRRGYRNTMVAPELKGLPILPPWIGDERFHSSHRSALLFKSDYYKQFNWIDEPKLNYYWPVRKEQKLE